jgi:hypothetical protein
MIKLLAADIGFASTGMAIMEHSPETGWRYFSSKCLHTEQEHTSRHRNEKTGKTVKRHLDSVSNDDIRRTEFLAVGIMNYYIENQCKGMACEIPNGGAQSASAIKCMAAATAMISVVRTVLRCPAIWITPDQSRTAAGWNKQDHIIPKGLPDNERRKLKAQRQEELKDTVMANMGFKYPAIVDLHKCDMEHIADALATFEAARGRDVVKQLEMQ